MSFININHTNSSIYPKIFVNLASYLLLNKIHQRIEILKNPPRNQLPKAREELFQFLYLNIESIQQISAFCLKSLFHFRYYDESIQNPIRQLINWEQKLSQMINRGVGGECSPELLFSFLNFYHELVEYLWFSSYLSINKYDFNCLINKAAPDFIKYAKVWMGCLSKKVYSNVVFKNALKKIEQLFQKILPPPTKIIWYRTSCSSLRQLNKNNETVQRLIKEGRVCNSLGDAYDALGERWKAIKFYKKHLQIAQQIQESSWEGAACSNLGNAYMALGKWKEARQFHKSCLKIAKNFSNFAEKARAYTNLGILQRHLGNYSKAIKYHDKSLSISKSLKDPMLEAPAYTDLGIIYHCLGEDAKSLEFHNKSVQISIELENLAGQGKGFGNLGNTYCSQEEYQKALISYKCALKIFKTCNNLAEEGTTYNNLGNVNLFLKKFSEAIDFFNKGLRIAEDLRNEPAKADTYNNIGNVYYQSGEISKALQFYKIALKTSKDIEDRVREGQAYHNLGLAYSKLYNFSDDAELCFRKSIDILRNLHDELTDQAEWQITFFEKEGSTYSALESLYLNTFRNLKALEVTDERRSRALVSVMSRKYSTNSSSLPNYPLSVQQMQELAKKLDTTFVIHSLEVFKTNGNTYMGSWVIPPQGEVIFQPLPWIPTKSNIFPSNQVADEIRQFVQGIEKFQSEIQTRGGDELEDELLFLADNASEEMKKQSDHQFKQKKKELLAKFTGQNQLASWYNQFIKPLQEHLPKDSEQTLTFITDGVLSQLPFCCLYNAEQKTYLVEEYAISVAPSLKILELLHQVRTYSPAYQQNANSLIVGNPDTKQAKNRDLKIAEQEADMVRECLRAQSHELFKKEKAEVSQIIQQLPKARWIHFACHGEMGHPKDLTDIDYHSVFEGYFKLAPDSRKNSLHDEQAKKKGYLLSRQIAELSLRAELVFLSTCYSGKGKIQREGTIGPIWSFLAAGAASVIATYWPLPDSSTTNIIVNNFYSMVIATIATKNKAQALRHAILKAMQEDRDDFVQWGAFFLSGLV